MNIGIDARLYGLEHAGIGRYVINLVNRVVTSDLPVSWTLFINPDHQSDLPKAKNLTVIPTAITHYSLAEQTSFLNLLNQFNLNLLHVPHFNVPVGYRRPFVTTIHDILWHQVRGGSVTTLSPFKYHLKYLGYRLVVRHAVSSAKTILVPSHFVKTELTIIFPHINPDHILVTYEGVDPVHAKANVKLSLTSPYLLYVGSAYPHKNIPVILRALKQLRAKANPDLTLVIVGSRSVFLDKVKQQAANMQLTTAVQFIGYQSDEAVADIMGHALCLVHPSKSEGFGLTGLEAMQAGTPVVAARATALPEIYQDAALYFNPDDDAGLIYHLETLMAFPAVRHKLIAAGYRRAKDFSWDTMAKQTLGVYKRTLMMK